MSISLPGRVNGNGALSSYDDNNELFLKVFSGEVLQTFETATVMKPLHMVRTISSGKSAQFPVTGIAEAKYFSPGSDLVVANVGNSSMISAIKHAEVTISIDDLLLSSTFIDKLDEAKNHYDVRSIYSTELGRALARTMDKNLIGVAINAATSGAIGGTATPWIPTGYTARAANISDLSSLTGTVYTDNTLGPASTNTSATATSVARPDIPTDGVAKFIEGMFYMAAEFDKKDVPSEDRYVVLTPGSYYNIVNSTDGKDLINRDYNPDPSNSFVNAQIASVAGFRMIRSNIAAQVFGQIVPSVGSLNNNTSFVPGHRNSYSGNFSRIKAVCFQKNAFGTVKLLDLAMESEYDIRLQGHLMVAKYAMGHGWLRPECAGILVGRTATT
jgi:hypothetical protein